MPSEILDKAVPAAGGPGGPGGGERLPGGDGDPGPGPKGLAADPARFGLWALLGTLSMLFIGFTSAYLVRRTSSDWRPLSPPVLLWWNTAILLASSLTLETARGRLRGWAPAAALTWLGGTGALGVLFVAGQLAAWRMLAAQGVYVASNPHHSFFYILTGLHIVHLAGGLAWFGVVFWKLRRMAYLPGEDGLGLFATYWHFLAGLWAYLLLLLFVL